MVRVEFLGPIGKPPMDVDVKNLEELSSLLKQDSTLLSWIENSAIAINDVIVKDKATLLNDGDKVSLLPPVCGG
jgi:molybdopterin synthase sulfur carrier subunit